MEGTLDRVRADDLREALGRQEGREEGRVPWVQQDVGRESVWWISYATEREAEGAWRDAGETPLLRG